MRQGDGGLLSHYLGLISAAGADIQFIFFCAQMDKEGAFRCRWPSEQVPVAKEKPIYFRKNRSISYCNDLPNHPRLAPRTIFLKLKSFPVTHFPTQNPSMLSQSLQDLAWHSRLHGIWPHRPVHCHLLPRTSRPLNSELPQDSPAWSLSLLYTSLSQHFIQDHGFRNHLSVAVLNFLLVWTSLISSRTIYPIVYLTPLLRCQRHLKLNCLKYPSHPTPSLCLSFPRQ